jgi:hypothetical protein
VLVGGVAHLRAANLALLEPRVRRRPVSGVDDEQEPAVREPVGDEVVDDAALSFVSSVYWAPPSPARARSLESRP